MDTGLFFCLETRARDLLLFCIIRKITQIVLIKQQRKKLLFFHHGGNVGGAPVSMLQLADRLNHDQFDTQVIFTQPGPIVDFAKELGVSGKVVNIRGVFFYGTHVPLRMRMIVRYLFNYRSTVRMTVKIIRQEQPALVHLNTSVLIPVAIGVKRANVPLVWHVREVPGRIPWLRNWQIRKIARLADCVIATSTYVKDVFKKNNRVKVIHNAIDISSFQVNKKATRSRVRSELGIGERAPVVLMIGNVQAVKGHYLLIKAAEMIVAEHPDVRFVIVADRVGAFYAKSWRGRIKSLLNLPFDNVVRMQQQIQEIGLSQYFVFTGYRKDIPDLLAASDVVAFLPQAPEGFGRPLIEAMAAGRPVIATDIGPTREILGDGTGILVPPGDASAVARQTCSLLSDRFLGKSMGAAGRKRTNQHFNMEQHISKITRIYEHVLSQRNHELS